ncbi:MAG: hypothetical protein ABIX01_23310 [Chitinophagaceae bacterium]
MKKIFVPLLMLPALVFSQVQQGNRNSLPETLDKKSAPIAAPTNNTSALPYPAPKADSVGLITLTLADVEKAKLISPLFAGISMETEAVLPKADGSYYFSSKNKALIALFRQLGVHHLRIGGNTVDDKTPTPGLADIDQLFGFARAAGVKVTYSVRLKDGDPENSARIAKHIDAKYKALSTGITIGNEADNYLKQIEAYLAKVNEHLAAMQKAAPDCVLNGPGIHLEPAWVLAFAKEFRSKAPLAYVSGHAYFGGNAYDKVNNVVVERNAALLRADMLSSRWHAMYEAYFKGLDSEPATKGIPFRMDETNSYYMGGAPGASNSMAAAIWALDYLYWWAEHGALGINFHTGTSLPYDKGRIPNGATRKPGLYAVYWDLDNGGFATQAVGYGIKAFDLGSHGKIFPVRVAVEGEEHSAVNVLAHAVLSANGDVYVTILNKEIGTPARKIVFKLPHNGQFKQVQSIALEVNDDNAGATEGFILGGAGIDSNGSWKGKWSQVYPNGDNISVTIPPTSALILHLKK